MRIIFFLVSCLFAHSLLAQQTGSFTDPRDAQTYATIVAGGKIWMRENLRFQTATSYCPTFNSDPAACAKGNYYLNNESGKVCPPGWNLPTISDWKAYIEDLVRSGRLQRDSIQSKILKAPNNSNVVMLPGFNILTDTLLQFTPIGWVEGNKVANADNISIWITDTVSNDDKYHIHLAPQGYVLHTHKHHVIDKPRKIRKFTMRCVCALSKNEN